jgi:uncharacterized Zn finger protein
MTMDIDNARIRETCTDAVFERGQNYRDEGRIQRIERLGNVVTAVVRGSSLYDVTVNLDERTIDSRCTCPYEGAGECKHVVAVLLEVVADPPRDESDRVDQAIEDVSSDDLRAFVRDALAENRDLRNQFLAQFGDGSNSVEAYRDDIGGLFDKHTENYPVVTDAIDFSQFFELAEQYRERDRYRAAATVYRALFEGIDDNHARIDAAYDHYTNALQSALDGYTDCVLAANPPRDEFETYIIALEDQATSEHPANTEQFYRAIDDLEKRR